MSKRRAIVIEGPEVVRNVVKFAKAKGKVKIIPAIFQGLGPQIEEVQSRKQLKISFERFGYEWNKRKPEPDAFRKELEESFEFQR